MCIFSQACIATFRFTESIISCLGLLYGLQGIQSHCVSILTTVVHWDTNTGGASFICLQLVQEQNGLAINGLIEAENVAKLYSKRLQLASCGRKLRSYRFYILDLYIQLAILRTVFYILQLLICIYIHDHVYAASRKTTNYIIDIWRSIASKVRLC